MLALIQRVSSAKVAIDGESIAAIGQGTLALIGVEKGDTEADARRLWQRISGYRIFSDQHNKMNLSVIDIAGSVLLVPQFTLVANTQKGMRPSFSCAAEPELSQQLFNYLCCYSEQQYHNVKKGSFGTDMQVSLCNDGPVTFMLQVREQKN